MDPVPLMHAGSKAQVQSKFHAMLLTARTRFRLLYDKAAYITGLSTTQVGGPVCSVAKMFPNTMYGVAHIVMRRTCSIMVQRVG